jgi:predicted peptidase
MPQGPPGAQERSTRPRLTMSPDRASVTEPYDIPIVDEAGNRWTLTGGGQVAFEGTAITWTRDAIELSWIAGVVWYRTSNGDWFSLYRDDSGQPASGFGPGPLPPDAAEQISAAPILPSLSARLPAPQLAIADAGTWVDGDAVMADATLPSGARAMHYNILPPDSYDPALVYPLVVYLHDNQAGTAWYSGPLDLTDTLNDWFNSAYVRANFPAVVVCPYADQSTDPTGLAQNWLDPANLAGTRAVVDQAIRDFSIDERRIYVTGDGMGGDAAWSLALTDARFAAALPLSGNLAGDPDPGRLEPLTTGKVSVFAVAGGLDPDSARWSRRVWETIAGNSDYPPSPGQTSGSDSYLEDPAIGRDVWTTYRSALWSGDGGAALISWLFAQTSTTVVLYDRHRPDTTVLATDQVVPGISPDRTTVPPATIIRDGVGTVWSLSPGYRVEIDGAEDPSTSGVVQLAWVQGVVWALDYQGRWRRKISLEAAWDPPAGRTGSPIAATARPLVNGGLPNATPGTWSHQVLTAGGITQHYAVLYPHGYDPARSYRVVVALHDHLMGNLWYSDALDEVTPLFAALNTAEFRSAYPAIIVAPFCDQRADLTGQGLNFGGLNAARQRSEVNAIQFVSTLRARASVSPGRVFVLGIGVMGGAAAWAWQIRYPDLFSGAMTFDGSPAEFGAPTPEIIEALREVPLWICHAFADGTISARAWTEPLYAAYGGAVLGRGARSPNGAMYLTEPIAGHGSWGTQLGLPLGQARWDSLFSR